MWFFILSVFVAWTGRTVSSTCSVELSPSSAVVRFGDPFSTNCSSPSKGITGMGWESSIGSVPLTRRVSSVTLNIESVTDWKFNPQCYVNVPRDQCYEYLPVTVYKTPDTVSLSQLSEMGPMAEGKGYRMQCDIFNVAPVRNLTVHWHMGKRIGFTQTYESDDISASTPSNVSSVFELKAHRDDDGTPISCEAELNFMSTAPNPASVKSKPHAVTVLYPPVFTKSDEIVDISDGSKMSLNCTTKANPMPKYRWDVPDSVRKANNDQKLNQPILSPTLQIPGSYNCTAWNGQGTATKRFTVIEVKRDRTTFAGLVGGFTFVGVVLFITGFLFVTPEGTFSCSKNNYQRASRTSSGPSSRTAQ